MTKKDELYEALLKEKERTIIVMSETIDYLRRELDRRPLTFANNTTNVPSGLDYNPNIFEMSGGPQAWVSEEEQDIRELLEAGHLTKDDADAALEEILGFNIQ